MRVAGVTGVCSRVMDFSLIVPSDFQSYIRPVFQESVVSALS